MATWVFMKLQLEYDSTIPILNILQMCMHAPKIISSNHAGKQFGEFISMHLEDIQAAIQIILLKRGLVWRTSARGRDKLGLF